MHQSTYFNYTQKHSHWHHPYECYPVNQSAVITQNNISPAVLSDD